MKRSMIVLLAAILGLSFVSTNANAAKKAIVKVKVLAKIKKAHCQHPKWSKNGKYLAFEVRYVRKRSIMLRILDVTTGKTTIVRPDALRVRGLDLGSSNSRGKVARELAWSPKKPKQYLFSSNGTSSVYNVYLSSEGKLKSNSKTKHDGQPAWSADGKRVVFTSARTGKGDLYVFSLRSMKAKRLTKDAKSTEFFATWNPAKKLTLAYVRHTDQSDRIFLIKNVFTRKSTPLIAKSWKKNLAQLNPSWSPDGKKIAFFTVDAKQNYSLYYVKLGGKPVRLAKNVEKSDQYGPAWSPDSKHVFYVQKLKANKDQIRGINVKTKKIIKFKTGTALNNELAVSKGKGGKWSLAFTAQKTKGSTNSNFRKLCSFEIPKSKLP